MFAISNALHALQLILLFPHQLTDYETDPPRKARCFETVRDSAVPPTDSSGGYAISVVSCLD